MEQLHPVKRGLFQEVTAFVDFAKKGGAIVSPFCTSISRGIIPAMPSLLTASVQVRTYELDSFGHVNNSVYLNYLEEARSEFLKQMGLSFHDFARHGVQLVIVESYVKYISAARYGDRINITGKIRGVSAVAAYIDYTLTETDSGRLVTTAWTRGAFVNAQTGKPTRVPQAFQEAFRAFSEP